MQQKLLLSENFKINLASLTKDTHLVAWPLSLYPLVVICLIYLTWGLAWMGLGHQPQANNYRDDPDSINIFITLFRGFSFNLLMVFYAILPLNIVVTLMATVQGFLQKAKSTLLLFILPIVTWYSAYFICVRDPMKVIEWFWD
jgi:hypothetical protein